MARPDKTHSFAIWEDGSIPTPNIPRQEQDHSFDDTLAEVAAKFHHEAEWAPEEEACKLEVERRRESQRSAVSSLPESTTSDDEQPSAQPPYTGPRILRPSFMRPESVKRMQMTSPPPFERRRSSSKDQDLPHSWSGTPTSSRPTSSPQRGKSRVVSNESTSSSGSEADVSQFPLILLHLTVLPLDLPWDSELMQELLPQTTLDNLTLLRSKLTDLVLHRGILVPHPRAEYDILEERLLEALELQPERVDKNGHFRPQHHQRDSTSSTTTSVSTLDSGIGSSVQSTSDVSESKGARCETCQCAMNGDGKWSIKVYAANGLMRAAAWSAAWSEMERVDVEISPDIGEAMRKTLNERQSEVIQKRQTMQKDWEQEVPLQVQVVGRDARDFAHHHQDMPSRDVEPVVKPTGEDSSATDLSRPDLIIGLPRSQPRNDLPQIYRPAQIPLGLLMKNYIALVLHKQDWKSIAIVFLVLTSLLLASRTPAVLLPQPGAVHVNDSHSSQTPIVESLGRDSSTIVKNLSSLALDDSSYAPSDSLDRLPRDLANETLESDQASRSDHLVGLADTAVGGFMQMGTCLNEQISDIHNYATALSCSDSADGTGLASPMDTLAESESSGLVSDRSDMG